MSAQDLKRASAFIKTMDRLKLTPQERYDRLRERYAAGDVSASEFEAEVSDLLREGL